MISSELWKELDESFTKHHTKKMHNEWAHIQKNLADMLKHAALIGERSIAVNCAYEQNMKMLCETVQEIPNFTTTVVKSTREELFTVTIRF